MELYINLNKSIHPMDFGKLVKRMVQVHGKNGKMFTRMQWVDPHEASTGHGMRRVNSAMDYNVAMKDGLDKHPQFHEAMKDQGVDLSHHDFEKHPHFYLPETEESRVALGSHNHPLTPGRDLKHQGILKTGYKVMHMDHGVKDHTHEVYDEDHFLKQHQAEEEFNKKYGLYPELSDYFKQVEDDSHYLNNESTKSKVTRMKHHIEDHWDSIKQSVRNNIDNDKDSLDFTKEIQHRTMDNIHNEMQDFSIVGCHPAVLSNVLEKVLGSDQLDDLRMMTVTNNLTINTKGEALTNILGSGYRAMDPSSYLENKRADMDKKDFEMYDKLMSADKPMGSILDEMEGYARDLDDEDEEDRANVWYNLHKRADAEYKALGLKFSDPKPVYIAYNPNGESTGGAPMYGDGSVIKVDDAVLKNCTANMNDTFYTTNPIPKVHDFNHLADLFIWRCLNGEAGNDDGYFSGDYWLDTQNRMYDDVPIELQYHKPVLEQEHMSVLSDPFAHTTDTFEFHDGMKSSKDFKYGLSQAIEKYGLQHVKDSLNGQGLDVTHLNTTSSIANDLMTASYENPGKVFSISPDSNKWHDDWDEDTGHNPEFPSDHEFPEDDLDDDYDFEPNDKPNSNNIDDIMNWMQDSKKGGK